jgi:hypothetical protein
MLLRGPGPSRDVVPSAETRPSLRTVPLQVVPTVTLVDAIDTAKSPSPLGVQGGAWIPRTPAPFGGLHQLVTHTWTEPSDAGQLPTTFDHRPGMNNRAVYEAVVRDLGALLGTKFQTAYKRTGVAATTARIEIDEKAMDAILATATSPEEKRALATFVLAHEAMHVHLRHVDVVEGKRPKALTIKLHAKYRKVFELQADYLAAKYLQLRGMDPEPAARLFDAPGEREQLSADYPPGWLRAEIIRSAATPGLRVDLFQNEVLDVLELLEGLVGPDLTPKA